MLPKVRSYRLKEANKRKVDRKIRSNQPIFSNSQIIPQSSQPPTSSPALQSIQPSFQAWYNQNVQPGPSTIFHNSSVLQYPAVMPFSPVLADVSSSIANNSKPMTNNSLPLSQKQPQKTVKSSNYCRLAASSASMATKTDREKLQLNKVPDISYPTTYLTIPLFS